MIKRSMVLGMVLATGCTMADSPESTESTATSEINGGLTTEGWDIEAKPADKVNAVWPASATRAQILYRGGPDKFGNPAFLAFVVWDHTTVGHVYWIEMGNYGTDFKQNWDNAFAQRTNNEPNLFDHWGGANGGGALGNPPMPHPQVDSFVVSAAWLQNAKDAAASIDAADHTFAQYAE
jgi:hypothetical protein